MRNSFISVAVEVLLLALGPLSFGTNVALSGGVSTNASFLKKYFPSAYSNQQKLLTSSNLCKYNNQKLSFFSASIYLGAFVGSMLVMLFTGTIGNEGSTIILGAFGTVVGMLLLGFSRNYVMLIFSRILTGTGLGFQLQGTASFVSVSSLASDQNGSVNYICTKVGAIISDISNIVGGDGQWKLNLPGLLFGVVSLIVGTLNVLANRKRQSVPGENNDTTIDSENLNTTCTDLDPLPIEMIVLKTIVVAPSSEVEVGNVDASDDTNGALELPGTPTSQVVEGDDEYSNEVTAPTTPEMTSWIRKVGEIKGKFRKILERKFRPQLVMVISLPLFQQCTGVITFGPVIYRTIGHSNQKGALLVDVVANLLNLVGTLNYMYWAKVQGYWQRKSLILGCCIMFVPLIVFALIMGFGLQRHIHVSVTAAAICVFQFGHGLSWGPLGMPLLNEILRPCEEIQSTGQILSVAVSYYSSFLIGQFYLRMLCMVEFWMYCFFAFMVVVMGLFLWLLLPETNGKDNEDIEIAFRDHWLWKNFVPGESDEESA